MEIGAAEGSGREREQGALKNAAQGKCLVVDAPLLHRQFLTIQLPSSVVLRHQFEYLNYRIIAHMQVPQIA